MIVLRSRRVVLPEGVRPATVWIDGERIARIGPHDVTVPGAIAADDLGDLVIMPGLVDSHVHVNEPGRTEWEGFETATRAAAAGGVTTIVDMPLNSIPATTSVEALHAKARTLEGKCVVDVGLWGGAVPGNAGVLADMVREGALGFKCFMVDSGVPEFGHVSIADLDAAMAALSKLDAPLLVHAELPGPIEEAAKHVSITDARSYLRYLQSRPRSAEDQAIEAVVRASKKTGARAHIVHLSSASAVSTLRAARSEGVRISAETTPHYLALASEAIPDGATAFKCAPPIREDANRQGLWSGLGEGTIDMVVTDHSPCTPELKKMDKGDFDAAWGGIASLQLGLSITWTEAHERGVDLATLVRWMCTAPAALAGLKKKGALVAGNDADLCIFDPDATFTVSTERLFDRNKVTPYLGRLVRGAVRGTYVRGSHVFDGMKLAVTKKGQWVRS
jgi:allantoinase